MSTLAVDLSLRCRACASPIPVNGVVEDVTCMRCAARVVLPAEVWPLLLGPGTSGAVTTPAGLFQVSVRPGAPTCSCGGPLSESGVCDACGARVTVRAPGVTLPGVVALIGEAPPPRKASEPAELRCASCGVGLRFDGSARQVTCGHCGHTTVAPDQLWHSFWPAPVVRTWWLRTLGTGHSEQPIEWVNAHCATCDDAGNVYALVSDSEVDWRLVSWDPSFRLRWSRPAPISWTYSQAANALFLSAFSAQGMLALWTQGLRPVHLLDCRDGTLVRVLGGGDTSTPFSVADARSVCVDADGSIVVLAQGVLRRHLPDGRQVDLWPGVTTHAIADEPHAQGCYATVGFDRGLFALSWESKTLWWSSWREEPRLRRFGADGKVTIQGPELFLPTQYRTISADKHGVVYGRWDLSAWSRVYRYQPTLDRFSLLVRSDTDAEATSATFDNDHREATTPTCVIGAPKLAVAPDGDLWLLGPAGCAWRIGPDGAFVLVSTAARSAQQSAGAAGWEG